MFQRTRDFHMRKLSKNTKKNKGGLKYEFSSSNFCGVMVLVRLWLLGVHISLCIEAAVGNGTAFWYLNGRYPYGYDYRCND